MKTRILILGDKPGPRSDPKQPVYPHGTISAAARLAKVMGISIQLYIQETERFNVWHDGDKLRTLEQARGFVRRQLYRGLTSGKRPLIIALGLETMRVFPKNYVGMKFGETRRDEEMGFDAPTVLYLPAMTSNRVWNDHSLEAKLTKETTELVRSYIS